MRGLDQIEHAIGACCKSVERPVEDVLEAYPYLEREDILEALSYAAWRAEEIEVSLAS